MAQRPRPPRSAQRPPPRRPISRAAYTDRRRSVRGNITPFVLLIIMVLVLGVGYVAYDKIFGALHTITQSKEVRVKPPSGGPAPALLQQPFNVLLIGVDLREIAPEEGARSDTLIVVHVDPIGKWASMLSIPRDTFVKIPHKSDTPGDKINGAYSWGFRNPEEIYGAGTTPTDAGAAVAAETVQSFLGVNIDYTAQVDFQGFQKLVDALDGITIDVPHAMLDAEYPTEDFGYTRLLIEPGLQRMDGATALRYARTRHVDSDFGRGPRQQQVIQAAINELKQRGVLGKLEAIPQLLDALRNSVKTTMPINDLGTLRGLASLAQEIGTDRIQRLAINPDTVALDQNYDNIYDIHWDPAGIKEVAQQLMQGPVQVAQAPEETTIQVQNGRGIKGLAGQVSLDLQLAGFKLTDPTDAPTDENPHTLILDYTGRPQVREKLQQFFKLDPQYVRDMSSHKEDAPYGADIVVLLGADYKSPSTSQGAVP